MTQPAKRKRTNTKAMNVKTQRTRRAKLLGIAKEHGYESWYKAETAIVNGKVQLVIPDKEQGE
jgi:hypothetical protein